MLNRLHILLTDTLQAKYAVLALIYERLHNVVYARQAGVVLDMLAILAFKTVQPID